jgi:hypothetical protein
MPQHREVLLTGTVPLKPASKVFETVAEHLGSVAPRIPDGEQIGWIRAVWGALDRNPMLEVEREIPLDTRGLLKVKLRRLKPGFTAKDLKLGPYGYAENAVASYKEFKRLQGAGKIPAATRFQITMPGPGTSAFSVQLPGEELLRIAREALLAEVQAILKELPAKDLAFQFDVGMEAEHEEYLRRPTAWQNPVVHTVFHWTQEQMADSVAWLGNKVPSEAELGFHICSIWHHDPSAGQDNNVLVDTANAIAKRVTRPITYFHLPVIPEHTQEDYEAFRKLKLQPGTKVYLGLVNLSDGLEGARKRIEMAKKVLPDFGIGFFCGLGAAVQSAGPLTERLRKATPETIGAVLDLHREAASL